MAAPAIAPPETSGRIRPSRSFTLAGAARFIACVVIAWLCTGLKLDEWIAFIACIGVATLVYAIRRSAAGARVPAES